MSHPNSINVKKDMCTNGFIKFGIFCWHTFLLVIFHQITTGTRRLKLAVTDQHVFTHVNLSNMAVNFPNATHHSIKSHMAIKIVFAKSRCNKRSS